jgi:hypothetical protein
MGFPLIPFAAGLAVGALATYGSRDPKVQRQLKTGTEQITSGALWLYEAVAASVSSVFNRGVQGAEAVAEKMQAAEEAEAPAKPVRRARARKSTATKSVDKPSRPRARRKTSKAESE